LTSDYLRRPIRSRLEIVRDFARATDPRFWPWAVAAVAEKFGAVFISIYSPADDVFRIDAVSDNVLSITGHTPDSLIGSDPSVLHSFQSDACPFRQYSKNLDLGQDFIDRIAFCRKDGTAFECAVMLARISLPGANPEKRFAAFIYYEDQ